MIEQNRISNAKNGTNHKRPPPKSNPLTNDSMNGTDADMFLSLR
jgi:hypothetical protein